MNFTDPIQFEPLYMERVWGGRRMEGRYGRHLPNARLIGESWELVDRPEAQSVVHTGPLRGQTLHELWRDHREAIFGPGLPETERFPVLIKILDAADRLSIQVHPPAEMATALGGEPKTEMWFIAGAEPGADLYVGLKRDVTKEPFRQAMQAGTVEQCVHRIPVGAGEFIFIPSGRIHAIGAGNLIFEIQQNSDTTYRVFDWNRSGLDGVPRELHIEPSMQSIDWEDFEPAMGVAEGETLVDCPLFKVEKWTIDSSRTALDTDGKFAVFAVVNGPLNCGTQHFKDGDFFLVPASASDLKLTPDSDSACVLRITIPVGI